MKRSLGWGHLVWQKLLYNFVFGMFFRAMQDVIVRGFSKCFSSLLKYNFGSLLK